jgi:hypothetical protein
VPLFTCKTVQSAWLKAENVKNRAVETNSQGNRVFFFIDIGDLKNKRNLYSIKSYIQTLNT